MKKSFKRPYGLFISTLLLWLCISCGDNKLFLSLPSSSTGIDFVNEIQETDALNILEYLYMYNGAGVTIGDINNDGRPDIYFASNQQSNKLYLNKGGMKFEDITVQAQVGGKVAPSSWTTGVTMVDINADGWLDIYVCKVHAFRDLEGGNELYVNNGDGSFTELAKKYGLDAYSYAQQSAFFDFDLDGDLDMYLLNQAVHTPNSYKRGELRETEQDSLAGDRLYENRDNYFVDISNEAGIYGGSMGYGLALAIGDINNDNYPDIYVSNDFHENDYLYYNLGDGTFEEKISESVGHTSTFSMGNDLADINNDGLLDIITLDMKPYDEQVLKTSLAPDIYSIYSFKLSHGYHYQFARNMLQLNQGNLFGIQSSFSEVGEQFGIDATDWSWGALMADFDLDGRKDIFITNGIPRRPNDLDFINYTSAGLYDPDSLDFSSTIKMMPEGKVPNIAYRNTGGEFKDVSSEWGLNLDGYSNGAAYGDLDNDGDLDLVVNNLDALASIYENTITEQPGSQFVKVKLNGSDKNPRGNGARVTLKCDQGTQMLEQYPVRGWLSSMGHSLVFGLGSANTVEMLKVEWPDGKCQTLQNIPVNQSVTLNYADAINAAPEKVIVKKVFTSVDSIGLDFRHEENDFVDFEYETLIPRMLSTEGPKTSRGDVNNDGLDDIYIGGAKNQPGTIFLQQRSKIGHFQEVENEDFFKDRAEEDAGSVFIDVNKDGLMDLYVVSGGGEVVKDFTGKDRLYINVGHGKFQKSFEHPQLEYNGSCVVAGDINQDGVNDLFIGGRSVPGSYGKYPRSRILLGGGEGELYDYTSRAFGKEITLGMVTDAVWLEDSKELVVVGDWMPITVVSFRAGKIEQKKLENTSGWWNTIEAADMDNDGDLDLLVGNRGVNAYLKTTQEYPVSLYVKDFDGNSSVDPVLSYYRDGVEYPFFGMEELSRQLVAVKKVYRSYRSYAESSFHEVFGKEELKGAGRWQVQTFKSLFLKNEGNGDFVISPLPDELQTAPIYGFATDDFDGDGNLDVLAVGNFFGNQVSMGRHDASYGYYMKGTGKCGEWEPVLPRESGFAVSGQARDIEILNTGNGKKMVVVSRNNDELKLFSTNTR